MVARSDSLAESQPKTRAEFLGREKESWAKLTATWRGLPEADLLQPGASGPAWNIKDVMNHIAAWQEASLRVIHDLLEGRWGRLGYNTDRFNALHYREDRDRSLAATHRRLSRARRELLTLLETVPEKGLLNEFGQQQIGWWAKYATFGHYEQHIPILTEFRRRGVK
jgi:hypothetical protein